MHSKSVLIGLVLVTAIGLGGCGQTGSTASGNQDQQAQQQFMNERGGRAEVTGSVERVEGNNLEVKGSDGTITTVQLPADGKIFKLGTIKIDEVKPGDIITMFGSQTGDMFQANTVDIRLKDFELSGGEPGQAPGGPQGGQGAPPAFEGPDGNPAAQPGGDMVVRRGNGENILAGTVEQVQGDKITVKTADGKTTTAYVPADVQINKEMELKPSEVAPGTQITAVGSKSGSVLQANQVFINP